jgi:hypothetical protein
MYNPFEGRGRQMPPSQPTSPSKQRPKSFQPDVLKREPGKSSGFKLFGDGSQKMKTWAKGGRSPSRPNIKDAFADLSSRGRSKTSVAEFQIDTKDIDAHLEARLDRRNIPENQRYKMRNLNDTIKLEFIRQDWAETQAKLERPGTHESDTPSESPAGQASPEDADEAVKKNKKKHVRGLSLTLSKDRTSKSKTNSGTTSPRKQKAEGSLGRNFLGRSTESVVSERPTSSGSASSNGGIFSKVKGFQAPRDFVSYLQKVQKPELVEVGKLHKLRLLLRNETVSWTDEFIRQGGMKEIVDLLHRIMDIEWR